MPNNSSKDRKGKARSAVKRGLKAVAKRIGARANAPIDAPIEVCFMDTEGNQIRTVQATEGISILALAAKEKIEIDHFCGGQCSCGTCRINVVNGASNLSKISGMEEMVLGAKHMKSGCRLACQARVSGNVSIQIPRWF